MPSAAHRGRLGCGSRGGTDAAVASRAARCRGRLRVTTALIRYAGISDTGGSPSGPPGAARFGATGAADPRRDRNGDRGSGPLAPARRRAAATRRGRRRRRRALRRRCCRGEDRADGHPAGIAGARVGRAVAGRAGRPAGHHGCSRGPRRCAGAPGGAPIDVLSQHRGLVINPVTSAARGAEPERRHSR